MLTAKGQELRDALRQKKADEKEADRRKALEEAGDWARDCAISLVGQCQTTAFGTTIEIIELDGTRPTDRENMRIDALERELGVTFDRTRVNRGSYAGEGGSNYAISMELGELLTFLEAHSAPS